MGDVGGGHLRGKGPLVMVFKSDASDNMKGFKLNFECKLVDEFSILSFVLCLTCWT